MEHLQEARMVQDIWDGEALTIEEREHLRLCEECQRQFATFKQMRDEFQIARQSAVLPEAEARYFSLFAQKGENAQNDSALQNLIGSIVEWLVALPLWDSRQQALAAGVRTAHHATYRLLFGVEETEVELMVEPQNGLLRVVGEVMREDADGSNGLALVELTTAADTRVAVETESDENGRFQLERVPPGTYRLEITPRDSQMVVIERLELT
jgi:hypothetical protein